MAAVPRGSSSTWPSFTVTITSRSTWRGESPGSERVVILGRAGRPLRPVLPHYLECPPLASSLHWKDSGLPVSLLGESLLWEDFPPGTACIHYFPLLCKTEMEHTRPAEVP